jgi:hypothetical protein
MTETKYNDARARYIEHRLPRLAIDLFAKSNGVVIKVWDASHPSGIEAVSCCPDLAERNERTFEEVRGHLHFARALVQSNHQLWKTTLANCRVIF